MIFLTLLTNALSNPVLPFGDEVINQCFSKQATNTAVLLLLPEADESAEQAFKQAAEASTNNIYTFTTIQG